MTGFHRRHEYMRQSQRYLKGQVREKNREIVSDNKLISPECYKKKKIITTGWKLKSMEG